MLPASRSWLLFAVYLCVAPVVCAQATAGYPDVFEPTQVLQLNVSMDPSDFETIRNDETFQIEVPAQFWADGEAPLTVMIRRKSADSINGKVSYKIDINKIVDNQKWNNLNKLSLENGDDQDVVSEGLAWYMHRVASGTLASYSPSLAAWTTLTINGQPQGVYVSVEQVDKQYLKNRSLWVSNSGNTWLFFQDDLGMAEYKEGPNEVSPTMEALNFAPFASGGNLPPAPSGEPLQTLLNDQINMDAMLMLGAVNAFSSNPDEMFNHAKNFFWADFAPGTSLGNSNGKRMYFPWDLDSALQSTTSSIYGNGSEPYQQLILTDPVFRQQFNLTMLSLLNGPFSVTSLTTFLNDMEPVLTPYLEADENNQIGPDVTEHFDSLRNWVAARHANVYQQVIADLGAAPIPGNFDSDNDVDGVDLGIWETAYGTTNLGDADQDGDSDGIDFLLWQQNYTGSLGPSAVPEPAAAALFFLGVLVVTQRRRGGPTLDRKISRRSEPRT